MKYFIPMLSDLNFVTKKYSDFLDWKCIVSLIFKGLHTKELGREVILNISKGMNNSLLSTNKSLNDKFKDEITQSLINEVLNMENVYVENSEGLRIDSNTSSLVKSQIFYILAEAYNSEVIIFKNTKSCAEYFKGGYNPLSNFKCKNVK